VLSRIKEINVQIRLLITQGISPFLQCLVSKSHTHYFYTQIFRTKPLHCVNKMKILCLDFHKTFFLFHKTPGKYKMCEKIQCTSLAEGFPCFFLSCKANARVKPTKTGHGPHSSKFLCCSMYCLFCVVLCFVCVCMCTELLPPGGYPIAVNPLKPELNSIC